MVPRLFILLLAASAARAEYLRIHVSMKDMDCASCSDSLGHAFEKMRGVKHADVDMKDGSVTLDLADHNRITLEQVWDTVKRIGFTPGDTNVTVRGAVKSGSLTISILDKTIAIEGPAKDGENIELKGVITPPADPRTHMKLRVE